MTSSVEPDVRLAVLEDAARITRLSEQLGYPCTVAETRKRLVEVIRNGEHAVLVAESDGQLLGWIHVLVYHTLTADTPGEIAGLVIDESHRSRGLGQLLMKHAEQWARDKGCSAVRLRSNVVRARAHAFYERLGYQVKKSQKVFWKDLG